MATKVVTSRALQLVTGGELLTAGRHYWEVEIEQPGPDCYVFLGAVRPGLDHNTSHYDSNDAFYISGVDSGLRGNVELIRSNAPKASFEEGDRIGVLLDLDAGTLRFYRNRVQCGPGFASGVTGPLVRAAELAYRGAAVVAIPSAPMPSVGFSTHARANVPTKIKQTTGESRRQARQSKVLASPAVVGAAALVGLSLLIAWRQSAQGTAAEETSVDHEDDGFAAGVCPPLPPPPPPDPMAAPTYSMMSAASTDSPQHKVTSIYGAIAAQNNADADIQQQLDAPDAGTSFHVSQAQW
jgi:hypothetical protein